MNNCQYCILNGITYVINATLAGFAALFLSQVHFTNSEIGIIMALAGIIVSVVQIELGNYIDKKHLKIEKVVAGLSVLMIVLAFVLRVCLSIKIIISVLFVGLLVIQYLDMPLVNSIGMSYFNKGYKINYGLARGIGSMSYALASFALGFLIREDMFGLKIIPIVVIIGSIFMIILTIVLHSKNIDDVIVENKNVQSNVSIGFIDFAHKYPKYILFIFASILIFISHTIVTNYAYQIISVLGGGSSETGVIGGIAAIVELPMMVYWSVLIKKHNEKSLLIFSGLFFVIKFALCWLVIMYGNIPMYYVVQLTQMFAFAIYVPTAVHYANSVIEENDLVQGQSLITTIYTVGAVLGSFLGGRCIDIMGVHVMLGICVMIALVGVLIFPFAIEDVKKNNN